jgi:hypothetical protein
MAEVKNYKRKPVVVQAIQFTGNNFDDLKGFGFFYENKEINHMSDSYLRGIFDYEGFKIILDEGDYLVRGIDKSFYTCRKELFPLIYEETELPFKINERFIDPNELKGEVSSNEEN